MSNESKKPRKINRQKQVVSRRERVIVRLEEQLKSKQKNTKEGVVELTEIDVKRINKELTILKERI
jgi:hypothetical protein